MTDEEALKELDRQEKRFAAVGVGNVLRLEKSAQEYSRVIVRRWQNAVNGRFGVFL